MQSYKMGRADASHFELDARRYTGILLRGKPAGGTIKRTTGGALE